jgi:acyl carrier protein
MCRAIWNTQTKVNRGKELSSSKDQLLSKISEIMMDSFDLDDISIREETSAEDIDEWDSLSHIRLIVAIERAFRIKFKNSEIESLKNVGDLINLVETKVA